MGVLLYFCTKSPRNSMKKLFSLSIWFNVTIHIWLRIRLLLQSLQNMIILVYKIWISIYTSKPIVYCNCIHFYLMVNCYFEFTFIDQPFILRNTYVNYSFVAFKEKNMIDVKLRYDINMFKDCESSLVVICSLIFVLIFE